MCITCPSTFYCCFKTMSEVNKSKSYIMRVAAKQAKLPPKSAVDVISARKQAERKTKGMGETKCASGEILRSAYIAKSGKAVPAKCIVKSGNSTNTNVPLVILRRGRLAQYGYFDVTNMKQSDRRKALAQAIVGESKQMMKEGKSGSAWLSIFRRLIYTGTLTKATDPKRSEIFRKDAYWVKKTYSGK